MFCHRYNLIPLACAIISLILSETAGLTKLFAFARRFRSRKAYLVGRCGNDRRLPKSGKGVQFELEKTPFKFNLNAGPYRSRLGSGTDKENGFNQPAFFVQVYFPFKRSLDTPSNFERGNSDPDYYDRLFTVCPIALFHITDKGGNGVGLGQELSFRVKPKWFIKSQLALAWLEASSSINDGLESGLNFHHHWYVSTYLNKQTALLFGFNHISNGRILDDEIGANFDMLTFGLSYTLL